MCFITMIAKTNTYQRNAAHSNTELNGNRNFVNVTLMLAAEVFDWRENKSEELTVAEPWISLREQWAGQPPCSGVTTRPTARAQGDAGQLRRARWAWSGALMVTVGLVLQQGRRQGHPYSPCLSARALGCQSHAASCALSAWRHQHIPPLFCLSHPTSLWKSLTSLTCSATLQTPTITDTALFFSVQQTPSLRKNVAAAPKS